MFVSRVNVAIGLMSVSAAVGGCGNASDSELPESETPAAIEARNDVAEAEGESLPESGNEPAFPPELLLDFDTPPDWVRSKRVALPEDSSGMGIELVHVSGTKVTLFQYNSGRSSIPEDVTDPVVTAEMEAAKRQIHEAAKLGIWNSAKEASSETVKLGDSEQDALWARFALTIRGTTLDSDIYLWTLDNHFLKLRCTSRTESNVFGQVAVQTLLTRLGNATARAAAKQQDP